MNRFLFSITALLFLHSSTVLGQDNGKTNHGENVNPANVHMNRSSVNDLATRFESKERDEYQKPDRVMAYLGDVEGLTIMDLGAGTGYFSVRLASKGAKVIAADVSDEFQEFLRKRMNSEGLSNIELRKVPYDNPLLKQYEVDMVLIVNTYHHIDDRAQYFRKVRQGTKPEGELVIIDFFKTPMPVGPKPEHKISIDEVIAELRAAGYSSFEIDVDLLPYQYLIRAK
jgi:ubiquinone/menaquinone biosynthesis C-methylase UbiE